MCGHLQIDVCGTVEEELDYGQVSKETYYGGKRDLQCADTCRLMSAAVKHVKEEKRLGVS
jgi:hypothetical protein